MQQEQRTQGRGKTGLVYALALSAFMVTATFGQTSSDDKRDEAMFPMALSEPAITIVNYEKPLVDALTEAHVNKVDENINPECFPNEKKKQKERPLSLQIAQFKTGVLSERVTSRLAPKGLRPATLMELLVFATTLDDAQLSSPIAALNGKCNIPGTTLEYIPVLSLKKGKRELKLVRLGVIWDKDVRFLAAPTKMLTD